MRSNQLAQMLMAVLFGAGLWIQWRQRHSKPVSRAFMAFFNVGGLRGSCLWTSLLVCWLVGGLLPILAFPKAGWVAAGYFAGAIILAGKAAGFFEK